MVICSACQHPNSPKAKFCAKCGGSLSSQSGATNAATITPSQSGARENPPPAATRVVTQATISVGVSQARETAAPVPAPVRQPAPGATAIVPATPPPVPGDEENEVLSVMQEARGELAAEMDMPVKLLMNFSKVLVTGYASTIDLKIENSGPNPVENLNLLLESNGLGSKIQKGYRRIVPNHATRDILEVEPARTGNFVLRCTVTFTRNDQTVALRGIHKLRINDVPTQSNFVINISDIQSNRQAAANAGLGGDYGDVNISNLVPQGAIRTLNDLLNFDLPEVFELIPLELDYEVSQSMVDRIGISSSSGSTIPRQFTSYVQSGTKLKLDPPANSTPGGLIRGIRLVARNEFRVGRSRQEADFLTWFWPRSNESDERTRRLSQVHLISEIQGDRIFIRDAGSTNDSTFEGHPLSKSENEVIQQRGTLILGHEYHLDVTPYDTTLPEGLRITNERLWAGPPPSAHSMRGCVRFIPTNSELALHDALWLFTDANFGSNRMNPLVIDLPGVTEVEGRFHYYRGNFWIESFATGGGVTIGGYALKPNEIAPITNGQEIVIGKVAFRATVEA